jgi:hypothetical protein
LCGTAGIELFGLTIDEKLLEKKEEEAGRKRFMGY